MESSNSKIITGCLGLFAALIGVTTHLLIKALSGAFAFMARLSDQDIFKHGLPITIGLAIFFVCQFNPKFNIWAEEVISEVKKVVFPSRKDTVAMTISVVIMVLISSVIITLMDWASGLGINSLMK